MSRLILGDNPQTHLPRHSQYPMHRFLCYSLLIVLFPLSAQAQLGGERQQDAGLPFYFRHFPAHEYRAHPQNWSITQDRQGLIYVGNYDGVLVYDGRQWDTIPTPSNTTVRSLAVGMDGRVFVGLQGDFGYLTADSLGRSRYVSLLEDIPIDERDFWDVWSTHATEDHAYFQTKNRIFRWDGSSLHIWKSASGFHTSFRVADTIYVREWDVGLLQLREDSLALIPDGEIFANEQVFTMGLTSDGRLLIATQKAGLYHHDGLTASRFETDADDFLRDHRLYHGSMLSGGYVALGMLDGGGIMIIDESGRVAEHLSEGSGLPDGWVNHVFADVQGGLWLALNNQGIVRIDPLSSITKYDRRSGLEGVVSTVRRHKEYLFVATSTGLFRLEPSLGIRSRARFDRIGGITAPTALMDVGDDLFVASHEGLFTVEGTTVERVVSGTFFSIASSDSYPGRLYLGAETGIALLERTETNSFVRKDLADIGEEVYSVVEDGDGNLWASARSGKIYYISVDGSKGEIEEFTISGDGVVGQIMFTRMRGEVVMLGRTGYYTPQRTDGQNSLHYFPYDRSNQVGIQSDTLLAATSTDAKLWQVFSDRVEIIEHCNYTCVATKPEVLTYPKWTRPSRVYVDTTGVAWISSGNMLVRFDPSVEVNKSYAASFPALLRRVMAIDSNRLLYGGATSVDAEPGAHLIPDLPYENNALRFEFSLPSYNDVTANEFQYWLEGKDPGWSKWTTETSKNYTNLREGTYKFHVRGRNAQGSVSPASVYTFSVLPPWYRSVWAYALYFLIFVGIVLFVRRHHRMAVENKKAKEQARELIREREVNERLQDLNERLKQANETLRKADRLKDEFLANTSHELRTPLTGILGCSAILREEVTGDQREFVEMIDENGERLLNTLDSLLDLARLRAGLMEMEFSEIDVAEKARAIVSAYQPIADGKGIDVLVTSDGDVAGLYDDHCLESTLDHLVGNAVKFTNKGRVIVHVARENSDIVIEVEDTGVGIDEKFMPYLFDEFKQESTGLTRSHEGNGLGLAVTARIVELMGGEIDVRSEKGLGSTFTVRLPLRHPNSTADGHQVRTVSAHGVTAV